MYSRLLQPPKNKSFFLFGPRGVGKSFWLRNQFPGEIYFDLLDPRVFTDLLAAPERLEERLPLKDMKERTFCVIIDEVQKIPMLLDVVHRLIETYGIHFILTGSSARKLRRGGANLLAGRAYTRHLFPFTSVELGDTFNLQKAVQHGLLPGAVLSDNPEDFLESYVATYLREEIIAEGILRNIGAFARFLEAASLSQAEPLNVARVAEDCGISRKVAEDYFQILEDLLLAERIPTFVKRAKRKVATHPKFLFFDTGVFRTLRPKGVLDIEPEIDGPALETLIWQELRALNEYKNAKYEISYWRTHSKLEVDFVLYGPNGFFAIEVKRSHRIRSGDLDSLKAFSEDYPQAKAIAIYGGSRAYLDSSIQIVPLEEWFGQEGFAMRTLFAKEGL